MKLGAIGDDFTGSSDLGLMLAGAKGEGLRTVQYVGVPEGDADPGVEAGIVALKSRSIPGGDAVRQSLEALRWLRAQGAEQILFKVCSTFDSTPEGNIGPVAEALIEALGTDDPVVVCPAFPATGRSVYQGHLFVGDRLLSESGLETHPLNPMTDPDLRRWLGRQTRGEVGLVPHGVVAKGTEAVRAALIAERDAARQLVVCDAVADDDLRVLGRAMEGFALAVCGSGLAIGLPEIMGASGAASSWRGSGGPAVCLSGSCSAATRAQVAYHAARHPARMIGADEAVEGIDVEALADWAMGETLPLIYSSADPETVTAAQERHGRERAAQAIEGAFARLATALTERGAGRIICAGGETSGAVVSALGAEALEIGPMIDPGVPAVRAGERVLALKSGNFGAEDFFEKASRIMGA